MKTLYPTLAALMFCFSSMAQEVKPPTHANTTVYDGTMPESRVKAPTSSQRWVFAVRDGTLAFVPYGPGIIRVTFTKGTTDQLVPSGWGTIASPADESDWQLKKESGASILSSPKLTLKIDEQMAGFEALRADGSPLCKYLGSELSSRVVSGTATNQVKGTFSAGEDEHFFGLGQHQDGHLDLRGQTLSGWHHYGNHETVGFPFLISTRNYAIMWDNPSKTQVRCAVKGETTWDSEMGDAISFFLIVGNSSDEVYAGYRVLTGATPLPPKAALGFIQSKARYVSQKQLLEVAEGYRQRHYPCDIIVADYLHWKILGDLSLDQQFWPDPKEMNDRLHALGYHSIISIWPSFAQGSRHYDELIANHLVFTNSDGTPTAMKNDPQFHRDAGIDSTNPKARLWLWNQIATGYRSQGFDYYWLDESEPDIEWHDSFCFLGPCAKIYNIFPLVHSSALYGGQRSVSDERALILTRTAYLGAQRYGTTFWSSDISATWDAFRNQIPTGLNMCASGLPYWSSDTGGWAPIPKESHPTNVLLDPSDARGVVGNNDDYPELFVRWFQYSTFCPTFRSHGNRRENEVWSFGKAAEPILVKYLKLRYQLLPYLYSQAYSSKETGAPFMRALFMDFPNDPMAVKANDEYMFGPAFLVVPVTSQGAAERSVYLPAGTDWYDFWTNHRYHGGQTITAKAPIDTLPLFVRAGSIVPLGSDVDNTQTPQSVAAIRVYPGADGDFLLYNDDGHTYQYETGVSTIVRLHYQDATNKFTVQGDSSLIPAGLHPEFMNDAAK